MTKARHAFTADGYQDLRRLGLDLPATWQLQRVCADLGWPPRDVVGVCGQLAGSDYGWHRPGQVTLQDCVIVYREATRADRRAIGPHVEIVVVGIRTNTQLAADSTDKAMVHVIDAMGGVSSGVVRRLWLAAFMLRRRGR
jgi:hypothetical protein